LSPPGGLENLKHRIRRLHPAGPQMRRSLIAMESASADRIRRYQERRLRLLVRLVAARSPFYRRWFAESGIDPASIRGLEDLPRLPLLTRADLMRDSEAFAVQPRRLMWSAHSSGTSGQPLTVYRTAGSSAYELAALQRQWRWFGLPADARRVVLRGSGFAADRPGAKTRLVPGNHQLLVSSYHLTPDALPEVLSAARAFGPHAVEGWPSSISLLAALMRDAGERLPVRAVITSSEVMSQAQRNLMREVFAGPIVDHYGQTERVLLAGGCEAGGYHVFPDYGIVEQLPVTGSTNRYELVGTPLHNWGFPLLRYRTGDEVGPAPEGPCACGRAFPRLGAIDGRVEDAFVAADGRTIPLPSLVIDDLNGLTEAQIVQRAPGWFEIRVVPGAGFDLEACRAQAMRNAERCFGQGQQTEFRVLDRIPRSASGKLRSAVVLHPEPAEHSPDAAVTQFPIPNP
jgi:phenylacetate-CoA ligase